MNFDFLLKTALFSGYSKEDMKNMAKQLAFRTAGYKKGDIVLENGTVVTDIGLVLSGQVRMEYSDFWGNKSILGIAEAGEVFAEAYACVPGERLMIDVVANETCEILWISAPGLFMPCESCGVQNRLVQNLMIISARKNLQLLKRSLHTSPKTIRSRLFSYFSRLISEQGSNRVTTPFDRQQLADYLNLDRSALSKELGKMKKEGLLEYHKNTFIIK